MCSFLCVVRAFPGLHYPTVSREAFPSGAMSPLSKLRTIFHLRMCYGSAWKAGWGVRPGWNPSGLWFPSLCLRFCETGQYSRSQETVLNIKKCVRLTQCLISKNCPINYSLGSDNQNIWLHLGVEMCSVGEKASVNFQTWACVQGYLSTHLVNSKIGNDVRRGKTDKVSHGFYFFILKNLQPTVRNRFYIVP